MHCFSISMLNFYFLYNLLFERYNLNKHIEDLFLLILIFSFSIIFYFLSDYNLTSVFLNVLSSIGNSGISTEAVPQNFALYFLILTLFGGSVLSVTSGLKFL